MTEKIAMGIIIIFFINFFLLSESLMADPLSNLPNFNEGIQAALESPTKACKFPVMNASTYSLPLYKRPELKDRPYAIFCWHTNKKLIRFGHSATTFFIIDQKESSKNKLVSKKRISVSSWPSKNTVDWKGKEEETFLHFNAAGDYIGNFIDKSPEVADNLCVPISKAESQTLEDYLFDIKDSLWTLSTNCNDFSRNMFSVIGIHVETDAFSKSLCQKPKRTNFISLASHVMKGMKDAKEKMILDTTTTFEFQIAQEELEAVNVKAK